MATYLSVDFSCWRRQQGDNPKSPFAFPFPRKDIQAFPEVVPTPESPCAESWGCQAVLLSSSSPLPSLRPWDCSEITVRVSQTRSSSCAAAGKGWGALAGLLRNWETKGKWGLAPSSRDYQTLGLSNSFGIVLHTHKWIFSGLTSPPGPTVSHPPSFPVQAQEQDGNAFQE